MTVDDGTGIVHQAPYGADDWEMAKAHTRCSRFWGSGRAASCKTCVVGSVTPDVVVESGTFFKDADKLVDGGT